MNPPPPTRRPRGRPRQFDEDTVLDAVTALFRQQGFAATSLDQIAAVSGLKRPSLYAAFGDKRHLFLRVLQHFGEALARDLLPVLERPGPPSRVLRAYFRAVLDRYGAGTARPGGCLVFAVAAVEAADDALIAERIRGVSEALVRAFDARLQRAMAENHLPPETDSAALAHLLATLQAALAVQARAGHPRRRLQRDIDTLLALLPCAANP